MNSILLLLVFVIALGLILAVIMAKLKKGNNQQSWLNRINRMSADFVVCNKDSSIVAVIELDDASHQRQNRQTNAAKKIRLWALLKSKLFVVRRKQCQT